ncbi:magnesium transporter CorA [Limnohabitans sp. 2KL-17]|uniref:magnesium transporter CorA family protein n=1 Tax=Limnohabitans sp. 2KL-17 TaxID=1100704 RepID=UPI000D35CF85|nr:magnesium transporter CorA family protein [Limnohabitans sp. 2KL-17]PUE48560.1 magnesium transporter CorA [Limnohabitans sp. 2KL-17]
MRVFTVTGTQVHAGLALPQVLPENGYVWIACSRERFQAALALIQNTLEQLTGQTLVDLHVSDLLNAQLPSRFDYSSHYDLMVFRRLAQRSDTAPAHATNGLGPQGKRPGPPVLRRIDTSPVGFAVFDRVLLSVHPADCAVREAYASRLLSSTLPEAQTPEYADLRSAGARGVPGNPADMMLRILSQMVDSYLDLRRELSRQLDHWQAELLNPKTRFNRWDALLQARMALHHLEALCDDQRTAVQAWTDSLDNWGIGKDSTALREHELLKIRSRDVLEHIERVVQHVRRLEHNTETAVQMHFNVQGNRTNDIMRTLTALTAIFLPLNLIAAVFGMNFEFMPWLHQASGFWWTLGGMGLVATSMGLVFWRKRYLARTGD